MIDANELRIGNFVKYDADILEVFAIIPPKAMDPTHRCHFVNDTRSKLTRDLKPIRLNEDWLLKMGFVIEESERYCERHEEMEPVDKYRKGGLVLYYNPELGKFVDDSLAEFDLNLQFVHQIQNLYFALTSEELTPQTAFESPVE